MPGEEFIIRGQTASGSTETLNFSGDKPGYAYRMTEFQIYPGLGIGANNFELCASVTAAKVFEDPSNPNFDHEGLIGTAMYQFSSANDGAAVVSVVNDTFIITQDLILKVLDSDTAATPVNWQCRFEKVKLSSSAEAVANFKQFTIFDG